MFPRLRRKLYSFVERGRFSKSAVLRPFSGLWACGVHLRNGLYDHQLLPAYNLPSPVLSVGNLVAGGGGKTPLVQRLASDLSSYAPVAVLSRGYRSAESGLELGDELTMLSRHLPQVRCFAGKNRLLQGRKACAGGARLILLDDGLQYRRLYRDWDIISMQADCPFGYDAFLPRGRLRDSPKRLRNVDAIVLYGSSEKITERIRSYTDAPIIEGSLQVRRICPAGEGAISWPSGGRVGAFCGIAGPDRFFRTVAGLGVEMVDSWMLADHEKPSQKELDRFALLCRQRGASALVCTEKDAVKGLNSAILPIFYLEMELRLETGQKEWQNLIEKIGARVNACLYD